MKGKFKNPVLSYQLVIFSPWQIITNKKISVKIVSLWTILRRSITTMDLHKLVFEVKGLGCIVDWRFRVLGTTRGAILVLLFHLQINSFLDYHFKVSSMSDFREDYSYNCEERQKREEGGSVEWRIIGTSNTENLLEIIEPAGKWMLDAR